MKPKGTTNNTEQLVKRNPSMTHDHVVRIQQSRTIFQAIVKNLGQCRWLATISHHLSGDRDQPSEDGKKSMEKHTQLGLRGSHSESKDRQGPPWQREAAPEMFNGRGILVEHSQPQNAWMVFDGV